MLVRDGLQRSGEEGRGFMSAESFPALFSRPGGRLGGGSARRSSSGLGQDATMANGVCSRRQRRILQSLLLLTLVCGGLYGAMVAYETHKQLKRTEAMALKYQQHQEALSAQLQVVYEHRSRLEKSLQKERLEHKKAKEDYLVYKLEAQQSLNKEKQDSSSRFNALHSQHQMLKTQHEDLKKQYYELHEQHQAQGDDHSKVLDQHRQRYDQLQQTKEHELSKLKESVYNLREENKQLRKAHQEIHVQLQDTRLQHKDLKAAHDQLVLTLEDHKSALAAAQVQVDEYKQLKDSLNKSPEKHPAAGLQAQLPHIRQAEEHRNTESRLDHQEEKPVEAESETVQQQERRQDQSHNYMEQPPKPEEHKVLEMEPEQNLPDENAIEQEHRAVHLIRTTQPQKSLLEQQQEQQRLAEKLAEERQQLRRRQEELQRQQLQQQREREERVRLEKEREEQQHREADLREQQLREEKLRKKAKYEQLDAAVVQDEEDARVDLEDENNVLHQEGHRPEKDKHVHHDEHPIEAEIDPADDPNNQGEDEFEEAEQQAHEEEDNEEPVPPGHSDTQLHIGNQQQPHADDQLVMAGNPDQQEDNLEEQYQEEGDEEAQDDLPEEQKPEEAGEEEADPYNEENGEQDDAREQEVGPEDKHPAKEPNEEENYEEEEEEPDEEVNRRAEM